MQGRDEVSDLATRLRFAGSLSDACHLVLERILGDAEVDRAAVVARGRDTFRGAAFGVDERAFAEFLDERGEGGQRLTDLVDEGKPVRVDCAVSLPGLGFGECSVHPFPGPRGIPSGALVLEAPEEAVDAERIASTLAVAGPTLARMATVEVLEDRLRRTERRNGFLDTVVHAFVDPVILSDRENDFLFANQRAEEIFFAGPEASEGRRRAVRINDLLFSSFLTQSVISGGQVSSREINLVDPSDGSDLLFEVLTVPVPASVGEEGSVISVLRDITDLRRALGELEVQFNRSRVAERNARRESDRLNVIIGNAGDPILVTDADSKIMLMNGEAERLFDETHHENGRSPSRRVVRTNDTKFTTLISDFLLQPGQRRVENLILQDPYDGEELPVEVVSSKIEDQRGELTAIVSVVHDLTEAVENERLARELKILNEGLEERIRLATEELEERNRRLEWQSRELQKASRLKSEFLASMSHELRTPINAMLGYTALLREEIYGTLNEKQENALKKIYGASQHLLALINDILDLSKIEAGKMPLRVEPVRLDAVVGELSQTIEPMVREKDLSYSVSLSDEIPVLETDRTKVKQILLNLLSNAVKFTNEGGIQLRARPLDREERVRIEVEDSGIGISPQDQETIFDDFRQVDQSSTRRVGGTGLGLSITRKLVVIMGGSIEVRSAPGEGSTFVVELPTALERGGNDAVRLVETDDEAEPPGAGAPDDSDPAGGTRERDAG